jgi:hypothetical protein
MPIETECSRQMLLYTHKGNSIGIRSVVSEMKYSDERYFHITLSFYALRAKISLTDTYNLSYSLIE